jgi:putative membrane protein
MFLEILAAIVIGVLLGTFTGLTPGIHINLVAAIMLSAASLLLKYFSAEAVAVMIVAMSITHVLVDFIPSVFLGAPSDATALAVLPGHKLLLKGRGYEAVLLSAAGGMGAVIAMAATMPLLLLAVKWAFSILQPHIGMVLGFLLVQNVVRRKDSMPWNFLVVIASGILGVFALGMPGIKQPLLPLLSGLFGLSTLIASYFQNAGIPIQLTETTAMSFSKKAKAIITGTLSGGAVGIFPALGPAQAAMLAGSIMGKADERQYLVTLGAVSASSMLFGIVTLYTIGKARNGSIAVMSEFLSMNPAVFLEIIAAALASCGIAVLVTLAIARFFSKNIYRIDYRTAAVSVMIFISGTTLLFSGITGLIILATGTAIGMLAIEKHVPRYCLMSCLMVPVIIYYF